MGTTQERFGDEEIRYWLIRRLLESANKPKAIIEELRVHNGNAVADVVSAHKHLHCYEIKSDKDSLSRIQKQAECYDLAFPRITLVTTNRHLERAINSVPTHWGIIVTRANNGKVVMRHIRAAQMSPKFDKRVALLTLWKSELMTLATNIEEKNFAKFNRNMLSNLLSQKLSSASLCEQIAGQIITRKSKT